MKTKLLEISESLRASFWFIPGLMTLTAIGLSFGTIALDWIVREKLLQHIGLVWIGGSEGARQLLSTIAGSMVTVAGVVFSITIVVLALASSQFGPRLLRNFMRDRGNQCVLGTFIATFTYCLLVLRAIRGDNSGSFVPYISVTVAIVLALVSVGVLIYFIHHVSVTIQAPRVVAMVAEELEDGIQRMFPDKLDSASAAEPPDSVKIPDDFAARAKPIEAFDNGYLQSIDYDGLVEIAQAHEMVFRLGCRPGCFITRGDPLLWTWPEERIGKKLAMEVNGAFNVGSERTPTQDLEFSVGQLVEVAVRALSPGINDPFTAVNCIDRLGAALCELTQRATPSIYRFDEEQNLRVIVCPLTFANITDTALNQIREYGCSSTVINIRLLEILSAIARRAHRPADRHVVLRHAEIIERASRKALTEKSDHYKVNRQFWIVRESLLVGSATDGAAHVGYPNDAQDQNSQGPYRD